MQKTINEPTKTFVVELSPRHTVLVSIITWFR